MSFYHGIVKHDHSKGIELIIENIEKSCSFRDAEENFKLILPYRNDLTDEQAKKLLESVQKNPQVSEANLCKNEYLPPLIERYGSLLGNQ